MIARWNRWHRSLYIYIYTSIRAYYRTYVYCGSCWLITNFPPELVKTYPVWTYAYLPRFLIVRNFLISVFRRTRLRQLNIEEKLKPLFRDVRMYYMFSILCNHAMRFYFLRHCVIEREGKREIEDETSHDDVAERRRRVTRLNPLNIYLLLRPRARRRIFSKKLWKTTRRSQELLPRLTLL